MSSVSSALQPWAIESRPGGPGTAVSKELCSYPEMPGHTLPNGKMTFSCKNLPNFGLTDSSQRLWRVTVEASLMPRPADRPGLVFRPELMLQPSQLVRFADPEIKI